MKNATPNNPYNPPRSWESKRQMPGTTSIYKHGYRDDAYIHEDVERDMRNYDSYEAYLLDATDMGAELRYFM